MSQWLPAHMALFPQKQAEGPLPANISFCLRMTVQSGRESLVIPTLRGGPLLSHPITTTITTP